MTLNLLGYKTNFLALKFELNTQKTFICDISTIQKNKALKINI